MKEFTIGLLVALLGLLGFVMLTNPDIIKSWGDDSSGSVPTPVVYIAPTLPAPQIVVVEPAQPIQPVQPVQPVQPIQPVQPTEPVQQVETPFYVLPSVTPPVDPMNLLGNGDNPFDSITAQAGTNNDNHFDQVEGSAGTNP